MRRNDYSSDEERTQGKRYSNIPNERDRGTNNSRREDRREDPRNDQGHDERVLAAMDRRNERTRNYAEAVRNPRDIGLTRRSSNYRKEEQIVPLHERIALSRRQSKRNMRPREDDQHHRNNSNRPREDEPHYQRNNSNQRRETEKDHEIESLRKRLENLERSRNHPESVTNHYLKDDNTEQPKNGIGAQTDPGPSNTNLSEMQRFIKEAIGTISAFARQLNVLTDSEQTHLDK